MDNIKVAAAALLAVAGIAGFYYLQESATVVRLAAMLAGFAASVGVLWTSAPGKNLFVFAQDSAAETRKVVWPGRDETLKATAIVFVFVVVMALFLWLVDAALLWLVQKLIGGER